MINVAEQDRNITGQSFVQDINTYNKNKYQVRFSNFPNFTGKDVDMNIFNLYLETFTIPDISIAMLKSVYMHETQNHPASIGARELQTVTLTFQCDENMKNWYAFYSWIWYMRHGMSCGKKSLDGEELLRMDCIDVIEILHCNNNGEVISKMKFEHCILNNLSSMELNCQTSEIGKFTVTMEVQSIDMDLMTDEE